jgi:trehalose 2-sulfotransferase
MKVGSTGERPRRGKNKVAALADSIFDFPRPAPLRKSYIVASTPRAGGAYLCAQLWKTGALGGPSEYLAYPGGRLGGKLAKRLHASSHADYLAKVIAHRTSTNGVFGVKASFKDFQQTLLRVPETLSLLSPLSYIYVERRDRLAHAVDVARAMQANQRIPVRGQRAAPLRYDRDLISKCLGLLERESLGWTRWFESRGVEPLVVAYEDVVADRADVVRRVLAFLDVEDGEAEKVRHPAKLKPRASRVRERWAARFESEVREGIRVRRTARR